MRLEELMIGDWVGYYSKDKIKGNPYPLQIHEIRNKSITLVSNSCLYQVADLNELSPIPLTPEILEKNNFLKVIWQGRCTAIRTYAIGEGFNLEEDNDGFNLVDNCSDSGDYGYESNYICDIKYIHELQHALKLCRIEKTIEL